MIITVIIPALGDPSNAYHAEHFYVLTSLAQVKSIVLLTDLPTSDKLITYLFSTCFDILASSQQPSTSEQLAKNVEINMISMLATMVDESQNLPAEVIDVIVAQFLRTDPRVLGSAPAKGKKHANTSVDENQTTLTLKEFPPSYTMAKTICNSCPDKMARYLSQYFNDVVVDASSMSKPLNKKAGSRRISEDFGEEDSVLEGGGPTEDDLRELRKVHQLLRELWRACPAVLQNVIPQLEAELSAENVQLRLLATETLGDIASGIGSAGVPPAPLLDSACYPPKNLSDHQEIPPENQDILTKPSSPQPFSQAHPHAFKGFLSRCHDKSPLIRAAWATAIGRILTTSAGGVGLNQQEEEQLVSGLAKILGDAEEKVRVAAVKAVGTFSFGDTIQKLGSTGGLATQGSVLSVLAERVRDRKHVVRKEAMTVLARMWGVASGEMMAGNKQVTSTLGPAPSKILDTYYANDFDIHVLLDHVLFEELVPLRFPPTKAKAPKLMNGNGHRKEDFVDTENIDPDRIRVERILILVRDLEERAKKVFFAVQSRQLKLSQVMRVYLQRCEDYNGGVMDGNEKDIKMHLRRLIENLARGMPDSSKVEEHLWKFAKMHDRRSYQLIRYCMAPESDYRTVYNAYKEFHKRLPTLSHFPHDLFTSMTPLLYRVSTIIYNKSHVPAIMEFSRSDEKSLATTAHELLREISTQTPEVLKAHVQEICTTLQEEAPNAKKSPTTGLIDNLKACATFASRFPEEIPKDRAFVQAIKNYALYGRPAEAAKYAVTILMTASGKKELLANELLQKCITDFRYGEDGFLSRLAILSRLILLAPDQVNDEADAVSDIAIDKILSQVRNPSTSPVDAYEWSSSVDVELEAKSWALKILVNRIRSHANPETLVSVATPVYQVLQKFITQNGEIIRQGQTPPEHKSRLRLLAARLCLKLCVKKHTDALVAPDFFNALAVVAQDPLLPVRSSFLERLKKYISRQKLSQRFYTIPFLLAFEPSQGLRTDTITWIRSRVTHFDLARSQPGSPKPPPVMESVFARLISLLAHHPDYGDTTEDLIDFARYIIFYLQTVASEENLSLVYQIAQRVKQCSDAISRSKSFDRNLYHLSDLAQLTIRRFEDAHGWNIQTLPGKINLPRSLYVEIRDHAQAQEIAEHNYLPDEVEEGVEALVKRSIRASRHTHSSLAKKRRSDVDHDGVDRASKRVRSLPIRKSDNANGASASPLRSATAVKVKKSKSSSSKRTNKPRKIGEDNTSTTERRRSGRVPAATAGKYAERDDREDDEEMGEGVAEWRYEDDDEDNTDEEEEEDVEGEEEANEREQESEEEEALEKAPDEAGINGDEDHENSDGGPKSSVTWSDGATFSSPPPSKPSSSARKKKVTPPADPAPAATTRTRSKRARGK